MWDTRHVWKKWKTCGIRGKRPIGRPHARCEVLKKAIGCRPDFWGFISDCGRDISLFTCPGTHTVEWVLRVLPRVKSGRNVKLNIHLHLVPELRLSGDSLHSPIPLHVVLFNCQAQDACHYWIFMNTVSKLWTFGNYYQLNSNFSRRVRLFKLLHLSSILTFSSCKCEYIP
jgi:hypothetical protein